MWRPGRSPVCTGGGVVGARYVADKLMLFAERVATGGVAGEPWGLVFTAGQGAENQSSRFWRRALAMRIVPR
jgi:hypothetical protein